MTLEEIREKYAYNESGWVYCSVCPLFVEDENGDLRQCIGYDDACDGKEGAYKRIQKYLEGNSGMAVLYVNWEKKDIISEREYKEKIEESDENKDEEFFNWLNLRYSAEDIFQMDEEDRKDVTDTFLTKCRKDATEKCSRYQRVEVEL